MEKMKRIRKNIIVIVLLNIIILSIYFIMEPNKVFSALFETDTKYVKYTLSKGLNIIAIDLGGPKNSNRENGSYGDATLIEQNGNYLLIDTGKDDQNDTLISFLKAQQVKRLSIYISHYHDDHYGKVKKIIQNSYFTVDKVYFPNPSIIKSKLNANLDKNKDWYNSINNTISWANAYKNDIQNLGVNVTLIKKGSKINIGEAQLTVIWDLMTDYPSLTPNNYSDDALGTIKNHFINDTSLVSRITYKGKRFLTAGDIEVDVEKEILKKGTDIKADIFKLSHHGGVSSNLAAFIKEVNPMYAYMPNNFTAGKNKIMWQGDRTVNFVTKYAGITDNENVKFKNFNALVNSWGSKTNLLSTLYNGTTLFNIAPSGKITMDTTRNYHTLTIKYIDIDTNKEIQNSISYKFNDRSVYHLEKLDYDKKPKKYVFLNSNYTPNQILSSDKTIICNYQKKQINVKYSTTDKTNKDVLVTLNANTELKTLEGWNLSKDKKALTKVYQKNIDEEIEVMDEEGYVIKTKVKITNIDKNAPKAVVSYNETNPTNKNVIATITANEEIQDIEGWTKTTNGKVLTKEYDNNIDEIIIVKDLAGNESTINIKIKNISKTMVGDLNDNGQLDSGDIIKIYRHIAQENNIETATRHPEWKLSDEKITQGDLNKNGQVDMGDVIKIQRYMAANNNPEVAQKHPDWLNIQ